MTDSNLPSFHRILYALTVRIERLLRPPDTQTDAETRRRTRLLLTILAVLLISGGLILLIQALLNPGALDDFDYWLTAGLWLLGFGLFALVRRGYTTPAAAILIGLLFGLTAVAPLAPDSLDSLPFYSVLPLLLTAIFFSFRALLRLTFLTLAALAFLTLAALYLPWKDYRLIAESVLFLIPLSATILTYVNHQQALERIRRAELQTAFDRALVSEAALESRVQERTRELEQARQSLLQAQYRYRALFEQTHDGVLILDIEGHNPEFNQRAVEMLGYTTEELRTLPTLRLLAPAGQQDTLCARLLAGEHVPTYEHVWRRKDDSEVRVEVMLELVRDMDGKPLHVQIMLRDMTERLRRERQQRLQHAALEATANAIVITDSDGQIEWANKAYTQLTGYRLEEAIGRNPRELVKSGKHDDAFYKMMWDTILAGNIWHGHVINRRKDGSLYTEEETITPVRDEQGTICHFIAIKQDITAREQADDALRQSEARQRAMLQAIPDLIFRNHIDGTYLDYHAPDLSLLALPPEQFLGKKVADVMPETHAQAQMEAIQRAIATGQIVQHEFEMRIGEKVRRFELRFVPVSRDEVLSMARDVTELWQARHDLETAHAKLEFAVDTARIAWWEMDIASGKVQFDPRKAIMAGYDPHEFQDVTYHAFTSLVHPDDYGPMMQAMHDLFAGKQSIYFTDYRLRKADGGWIWFHDRGELAISSDGRRVVRGFVLDITDHKQAQQREIDLTLERERVTLLRHFIEKAMHEFRTPLAIINSNAYIMARVAEPENRHDRARTIQHQVGRISKLVEMLSLMTELESGRPVSKPIDLPTTLEQACQGAQKRKGSNPTLYYSVPLTMPPVNGNADHLEDAFHMLLDNAFRYTPSQGWVSVTASVEGERVYVEIRDSGPGIAEAHLRHIFETFWRLDEAHTTPGLGLGLSIARKIIELYGGAIEVESEVGRGTLFRVMLPIATLAEPQR